MDIQSLSNEELATALTEANEKAKTLFALDPSEVTVDQANEAQTLVASIRDIETEQAARKATADKAGQDFAAARESFTAGGADAAAEETEEASEETDETEEASEESEETEDAAVEAAAETTEAAAEETAIEATEEATVTASARGSQKINPAKAVARKVARPAVKAVQPVTITAAADVPGFATGAQMEGYDALALAMRNRVKGFNPFNERAAMAVRKQTGNDEVLHKFGVAQANLNFEQALVASTGNDYAALQTARRTYDAEVLTAAGWCAPSEPVYSFLAGYVVDGLITVPEISAPRGGVLLTTGPARSSQGTALDDFGFVQTEAQAEAGQVKTCETIVCPDFVDHRLDAIGYCYKIPFLTQKAYPELITDALRFAGVLYAHKVNARIISDIVALADPVVFNGYGPSFTDTLEALSIIALKERRKWSIGVNTVLEVKLPEWVKEVFRADMSRRNGAALDSVSDAQIAQHFVDRRLNVEYVADWQELTGVDAILPGVFEALIYPAGAVVKAVEDVVNISTVYDAASLSINEYTGVFFEQGLLVAKAGFSIEKVNIPVNTAGQVGAMDLTGIGDWHANGSL